MMHDVTGQVTLGNLSLVTEIDHYNKVLGRLVGRWSLQVCTCMVSLPRLSVSSYLDHSSLLRDICIARTTRNWYVKYTSESLDFFLFSHTLNHNSTLHNFTWAKVLEPFSPFSEQTAYFPEINSSLFCCVAAYQSKIIISCRMDDKPKDGWQVSTYLVQLLSYLIVRCATPVFWGQEEKKEQRRSFWRAVEEHSGYSLVWWTMPGHRLDWFLPVNRWMTLESDWGWDLCLGLRSLPHGRHTLQNSL